MNVLTPEDIKLLSKLMDEKLKPINERLDNVEKRLDGVNKRFDSVEERLDTIEENTDITRVAVNEVIKWIDVNFRDEYPFPTEDKPAI